MNTFTFTNDELELLVELVATADDSDQEQLVILSRLSKVLNREACISFSQQVPETFDQSGFEALKFTEVGSNLYKHAGPLLVMDKEGEPEQISGGLMTIQVPKFARDGGIIFNPKEK